MSILNSYIDILGKIMEIRFGGKTINVRDEDVNFYKELETRAYNEILSDSKIERFTFRKIVFTIVLLFFWIIPGILNILYIFSKKHAKLMAIKKASREFYIYKIDDIPFYSSAHGITVLENLGSINEDSEVAAAIKAYNKGANAIINIGYHTVVRRKVTSDVIGKGVHTDINENEHVTGDLAIIENNKS